MSNKYNFMYDSGNCLECPYCKQSSKQDQTIKYICSHKETRKRINIDHKYCYVYPVIGCTTRYSKFISVPKSCPVVKTTLPSILKVTQLCMQKYK